jgi:DNA-binding transcriptional LysR family regulator
VPHSLAVPDLLAGSDMLSIVPAPLAQAFVARRELLAKALPYATQQATMRAVWHRRHEHDPAHVWLREQLARLALSFRA